MESLVGSKQSMHLSDPRRSSSKERMEIVYEILLTSLFKSLSANHIQRTDGSQFLNANHHHDVEETKREILHMLTSTSLHSFAAGNPVDLSPWPVFKRYIVEYVRIHQDTTLPLLSQPLRCAVYKKERLEATLYALAVILQALPSFGDAEMQSPSRKAFMKVDDQLGMTPLMFVLKRVQLFENNEGVLRVLFQRGGFSDDEWQSGKVILLLGTKQSDDVILHMLLQNFRQNVQHYINMFIAYNSMQVLLLPGEQEPQGSGTVLHFCCQYNMPCNLPEKLRLLATELGADPRIPDSFGRTPLDIMRQRLQHTRIDTHLQSGINFLTSCQASFCEK